MIGKYIQALREYVLSHETDHFDGESVIEVLYECYSESTSYDNEQIKADFKELYESLDGMTMKEIDGVVYAVCALCQDYERAGFREGIRIGIQLNQELRW